MSAKVKQLRGQTFWIAYCTACGFVSNPTAERWRADRYAEGHDEGSCGKETD